MSGVNSLQDPCTESGRNDDCVLVKDNAIEFRQLLSVLVVTFVLHYSWPMACLETVVDGVHWLGHRGVARGGGAHVVPCDRLEEVHGRGRAGL